MGVASALVFANLGAAYGTAKSGVGIASLGVIDSSKIFKSLIPIIMAGILGIYGVIVAVLLNQDAKDAGSAGKGAGYKILGAGLSCGLSSLASGLAIGVAGDAGVRAFAQSDGIFVGMILILIFAEAIGLYGLIVAILIRSV
jgi:V-type H+-transporting ATPase proteolipid subunit